VILDIKGEQRPDTIKTLGGFVVTGGNANIDVVFPDHISRGIPESIIRGVQWNIGDAVASDSEITELVGQAVAAQNEAIRAQQEKAAAHKAEVDALPAKFPYLSKEKSGAANMKTELRRAFPGVKFSVRFESYSGGSSIRVSWADGPTVKQVDEIADKYKECDFDGMDDSTHYRNSAWTEVFGGAKYVSTSRHYTRAFLEPLAERVAKQWGKAVPEIKSGAVNGEYCYLAEGERLNDWNYDTISDEINREASKTAA
jgi:hypothetical protein